MTAGPCPVCGAETDMGYGLAGGGIGPYVYCNSCDYFQKFQDLEEIPDASKVRGNTGPVDQGGTLDETGQTKGRENL